MGFHDHFSAVASRYAAFRPTYPDALYAYLAGLAPAREQVWDAGTGSGQAARGLAEHFAHVTATDASADQLACARPHPRVVYRLAREADSGLAEASADLVTAAQAAHWFDHAAFHREVARVLKPGGVLAVWCYDVMTVDDEVDPLIDAFYRVRVGPYWPPERKTIEHAYRDLPFPYRDVDVPTFAMETRLDRGGVLGYIGTWSAVQRCRAVEGIDPMAALAADLARVWPDPAEARRAVWPISLRAGRA